MDSKETDQLTIVNRSMAHNISKKLIISKIPYFERVLSNDSFMESKENMVKLNFDEQAFQSFLTWVESDHVLIKMKNLINLCTIMDYFGINNSWMDRFVDYFRDKFSISHLPDVIPQVTQISKCINSGTLNAFICRHFLKITNTTVWLNYPFETIEYICQLDLMIHSEMQVFNAIMKWVTHNFLSREDYLESLLELVRYCDLDNEDLLKIKQNYYVKNSDFEPIFCSPDRCTGDCQFNRSNQYYSVLIEEFHGTDLQIKVLDRDFQLLIKQVFKLDESMPLHLFPNENVSDIVFDSGSRMIRIDWSQNKYLLLNLIDYKSYYYEMSKCIFKKQDDGYYKIDETRDLHSYTGSSLLEFDQQFVLISTRIDWQKNNNTEKFICWTTPSDATVGKNFTDYRRNYLTTALDNNIYILNSNLELIQFNIENQRTRRFKCNSKAPLNDLILTSTPGNDKVVLIDKSTRIVDCFNVKDEEWMTIGLLADEIDTTDSQRKSDKLLTLTSAFLRLDRISPFLDLS